MGSNVKMPTPCGKGHFIYYPAALAQEGIQGRFYWFMSACECDIAYLIHVEHDGAHVKSADTPEHIKAEYKALAEEEVSYRDTAGAFICKRDASNRPSRPQPTTGRSQL